jgi:peptidoglycan/xylan/chitin deacetylase (PgdA/CDA1 family)
MNSPLHENINNFRCTSLLKEMIAPQSVIHTFLFFAGMPEFALAEHGHFVAAHTNKYVIYEFWKCVQEDSQKIVKIVEKLFPQINNKIIFHLLQETWPTYPNPFLRAALFFLLNRCSQDGLISAGKLDYSRYNPLSLAHLKKFKIDNFHLQLDHEENFINSFQTIDEVDYMLFPIGKYNYNFFEYGKSIGYETTSIHHKKFHEAISSVKDKWIVLYKHHPAVHLLYKEYSISMLDKYGRQTKEKDNCEELVIANF